MREKIALHSFSKQAGALLFATVFMGSIAAILFSMAQGSLAWLGPVLFGLLFVGLILASPYKIIVDRGRERILLCSVLNAKDLGNLQDARELSIRTEMRGSGKSRHQAYVVRLDMGCVEHELEAPNEYLAARRLSESMARTLKVNILDAGAGDEVVERSHAMLDASFVDTTPLPEGVLPPAPLRLQMLSPYPNLAVRLPRAHPAILILPLFLMVIAGVYSHLFFPRQVWVPAVAVGLVLLGSLPTVLACLGQTVIEAGPGSLAIRYGLGFLSWREKLDPKKIEEVRQGSRGLYLLSDRQVKAVRCRLEYDEGSWLKLALARAVRG